MPRSHAPRKGKNFASCFAQTPAAVYLLAHAWQPLAAATFGPEDLLAEYVSRRQLPNVRTVMDYLANKCLTRYFDDGLQLMREAGIEVDELLE